MNEWLSIQALRGVAVLGVVAFHSLAMEHKYSGGDLLLPDFLRLGQAGVDLFFVISGFIIATVTKGRFARNGEIARFLWGRMTKIYPTYWFYFFLTAAVFLVKPNWVNASQGHQANLLTSFLLLPSNLFPLVLVAWSLIHELWFYLVFSVLLMFSERFLLPCLFLWGAIVVTVNLLVAVADLSPGVRIALHPYTLEFILGTMIYFLVSREQVPRLSARNATLIVALVLAVGLPMVYAFDVLNEQGIARMSVVGTLFGLLVLSMLTLEKLNKFTPPKFLQFVGDMSYTIYLSHVLVLSAIGRLWMTNAVPNNLLDNLLVWLTMLAATVGYGWVGYRLVEQPVLRVSHRLRLRWFDTGGRNKPGAAINTGLPR